MSAVLFLPQSSSVVQGSVESAPGINYNQQPLCIDKALLVSVLFIVNRV